MEYVKQQHNVSQWVAEYSDGLYAYAVQRVKDRDYANDIVQETFLSAWRSVAHYKGDASVKTWLFTILKNKLIDHYRKIAKRQTEIINNDDHTFFDDADHWRAGYWPTLWNNEAQEKMDSKEFYKVFNDCKSKLRELYASVFVMKYVDGLTSEEICKTLNITPSNYWVLIHRAKVQLRACLEKNWFTR